MAARVSMRLSKIWKKPKMATVRWCIPVDVADDNEILCMARTPPVVWDAAEERLECPADELRAIVDAEHELVRQVALGAQLRMHGDHVMYVSRRNRGDHCCTGQRVTSETLNEPGNMALVPTGPGAPPVVLQAILRKRNLSYGIRPGHAEGDMTEHFAVGWELDAVLYADADWPF